MVVMTLLSSINNKVRFDRKPLVNINFRSFQEEVLCVVKVFQSGMVSACPGWSEEEAEDYDDNRIFASDRGIAEMMNKGPRLTTYKFTTSAGSLYEYTIEPVGDTCFSDDTEQMIAEQNDLFREIDEKRRELIRKEFEPMLCLFDTSDSWDHQAHIEIVSADGFSEPNLLLCAPFGTKIMIRFKVYSCDCSGKEGIVSKGVTNSVQNNPSTPCSLEFVTFFNLAFIVIAFVSNMVKF